MHPFHFASTFGVWKQTKSMASFLWKICLIWTNIVTLRSYVFDESSWNVNCYGGIKAYIKMKIYQHSGINLYITVYCLVQLFRKFSIYHKPSIIYTNNAGNVGYIMYLQHSKYYPFARAIKMGYGHSAQKQYLLIWNYTVPFTIVPQQTTILTCRMLTV